MRPESHAPVTVAERHAAAIAAAQDDARQAVDLLLDAIGRILLTHIEAHAETTPRTAPQANAVSRWTPDEDELLRRHYPEGGSAGVIRAGVNRTRTAILSRARGLNLTRSNYHWTAAEDALIKRHYPRGGVKAVKAAGVTRDDDAIYRRADRLNVARDYTLPPPPPPLTVRQRVLAALVERDAADMLLDAEDLTQAERGALRKLRRDKLATQDAPGLWRPTLGGLIAAENGASQNQRKEPT